MVYTSSDFRAKFKEYTKEQVNYALCDIDESLQAKYLTVQDHRYINKLNAEREAAVERLQEIARQSHTKENTLRAIANDYSFNIDGDGYEAHSDVQLVQKISDLEYRAKMVG